MNYICGKGVEMSKTEIKQHVINELIDYIEQDENITITGCRPIDEVVFFRYEAKESYTYPDLNHDYIEFHEWEKDEKSLDIAIDFEAVDRAYELASDSLD